MQTLKHFQHSLITIMLLFCVSFSFAQKSRSITQHGITWTFDKAYETGRFVNGDYWVVGAVVVKHTAPVVQNMWEAYRNSVPQQPGAENNMMWEPIKKVWIKN
jgi:hypothetical protein